MVLHLPGHLGERASLEEITIEVISPPHSPYLEEVGMNLASLGGGCYDLQAFV